MQDEETQAAPAEDVAPEEQEVTEPKEHEDASAASDGDDTPAENDEEEKPKKRPNRRVQKRIDKLTHQVREQERLIQELQTPKDAPKGEPSREDYDDYEKYVEDKAIWKVEQRLAKEAEERQTRTAQERQQEAASHFESAKDAVIDAGLDSFDDFEDVALSDDLQITEDMATAILASDTGHELWYHLGKHPAKAEKIASLPPVAQILELGRLESSLKVSKQPSNAPPPPKPVGTRSKSDNALRDDVSVSEWMKRRNKQRGNS